jgi:hypothetical protein
MSLPSSDPLAIPPVSSGPVYMPRGRSSSESSASAGPNSANITRSVRAAVRRRRSPATRWRRHSVVAMTP